MNCLLCEEETSNVIRHTGLNVEGYICESCEALSPSETKRIIILTELRVQERKIEEARRRIADAVAEGEKRQDRAKQLFEALSQIP